MVQGGWERAKRNRDMFVHGCTGLVEEGLLVTGWGGGGAMSSSRQQGMGFRPKRSTWLNPGAEKLISQNRREYRAQGGQLQVSCECGGLERALSSDGLFQLMGEKRWDEG